AFYIMMDGLQSRFGSAGLCVAGHVELGGGHELPHLFFLCIIEQAGRESMLRQIERRGRRMLVHRRGLCVAVIRKMATGTIHIQLADVRGIDWLVAAFNQLFLDESLEDTADEGPLGHPQYQAAAALGTNGK